MPPISTNEVETAIPPETPQKNFWVLLSPYFTLSARGNLQFIHRLYLFTQPIRRQTNSGVFSFLSNATLFSTYERAIIRLDGETRGGIAIAVANNTSRFPYGRDARRNVESSLYLF